MGEKEDEKAGVFASSVARTAAVRLLLSELDRRGWQGRLAWLTEPCRREIRVTGVPRVEAR